RAARAAARYPAESRQMDAARSRQRAAGRNGRAGPEGSGERDWCSLGLPASSHPIRDARFVAVLRRLIETPASEVLREALHLYVALRVAVRILVSGAESPLPHQAR